MLLDSAVKEELAVLLDAVLPEAAADGQTEVLKEAVLLVDAAEDVRDMATEALPLEDGMIEPDAQENMTDVEDIPREMRLGSRTSEASVVPAFFGVLAQREVCRR